MNKIKVQDKYNKNKVWLIKTYEGGPIYYNQENKGQRLNKRYLGYINLGDWSCNVGSIPTHLFHTLTGID
jgi:hypothetical protein